MSAVHPLIGKSILNWIQQFVIENISLIQEITCHMGRCYRRHGRGDFPAFTPAEADIQFIDRRGMQGWWLYLKIVTHQRWSPISEITGAVSRLEVEPATKSHKSTDPPCPCTWSGVGSQRSWSKEGTVRHCQSKETSILWSNHEETR